ncbi:hypothetical protein S7335_210 [Synechococcus sp. PCC 7335]|uniref:hypothetical protein n=1 Tax=Synechococcus sp. (strain ATCC 29403 / PCC 7335) TaxID=91464 RepID=UPI00017EE819|nr:hypothetical protein [Synechococcus sp. PCC 7335]EDX83032.1 hypothetical protein S7335_210 [Synechococcus sp. PCC 7335]
MDAKTTVGIGLAASNPIFHAAAIAAGVAKTGTAIGTLHGAAQTSATAAWVGFGSMKVGLFVMNAFPIIGGLLILDSLCGSDHGSPLIDWYEEAWKKYEAQCEMEELKKEVDVDPDHRVTVTREPSSLAQQEALFLALEVEHELYQLKKKLGLL